MFTLFTRNIGIITEAEQQMLARSTVAIAGVGGDGGLVAELLCRLGVGALRLADPERFERENLNRQNGSSVAAIGRYKADVIAELLTSINPDVEVEVFRDGVQPHNVEAFLHGCNLVIDESEYTQHEIGVLLARGARRAGLTMVTGLNVAFGTVVTAFDPDGLTLEEHLGLSPHDPLDAIAATPVALDRWIPRLPPYLDEQLISDVASGARTAPSVAPGVALTAGAVVTQVFAALCGRGRRVVAPRVLWFDPLALTFELVDRPPR